MKQNVLNDFKNLLAYFITHLEWVENNDKDIRGFHQYLKHLLDKKIFRKTGQGYKGARIQDQIKDWESYNNGIICINIQGNYGDYTTAKCYLNWKNTGLNIRCRWENSKIISLFQEEYFYWEESKRRLPFGKEMTIEGLGLFDRSNEINDELKSFFESFEKEIIRYNDLEKDKTKMIELKPYTDLLKYKKQIILQGPPGTGKTKLAKEIAKGLIKPLSPREINHAQIYSYLKEGDNIKTPAGNATYTIKKFEGDKVVLAVKDSADKQISIDKIISYIDNKKWLEEIKNGDERGAASLAKYIFDRINTNKAGFEKSDQYKIIQFHPSYTYEDFVRGVVAKPNEDGEGIVYNTQNKILASFAKTALENYLGNKGITVYDEDFRSKLTTLIDNVNATIDVGQEYFFGEKSKGQIIAIKEDGFLYSFPNRPEIKYKLLFSDLEKTYAVRERIKKPIDLRDVESEIGLSMKGKYPYYYMLLRQLETIQSEDTITKIKIEPKNYVLIIDEINRANLSSVLGELIYALEYRGEEVDSMYEVGGSNKLILPPNLYIIGTMNTADRSVGHIDYAIRRRFAFVDVLPQLLEDNEEIWFNTFAYEAVKALFTPSNVSADFDVKDIQIGHSYFIVKKEDAKTAEEKDSLFRMKMKYEVVPILNEYVKDGILNPDTKNAIEKIKETYA